MKTEIFPVTGMMCGGCVRTVQTILKNQAGVEQVTVSLENASAEITYNEADTSPEKLADAVGKMGYKLQTV